MCIDMYMYVHICIYMCVCVCVYYTHPALQKDAVKQNDPKSKHTGFSLNLTSAYSFFCCTTTRTR